jgi:hypothetical protein
MNKQLRKICWFFAERYVLVKISDRYHPPTQHYNSLKDATDAFTRILGEIFRGEETKWTATDRAFFSTLEYCCQGRSIFTTAEKKLGLAPKAVRPNDIVVVLLGCISPMVLRPVFSSQYQIVGEAYMQRNDEWRGPLGTPS